MRARMVVACVRLRVRLVWQGMSVNQRVTGANRYRHHHYSNHYL